jgi:hypothetical protein
VRTDSSEHRVLPVCRLWLDGDFPDHPTFKNRHDRFRNCDLLQKTMVRCCATQGLLEFFEITPGGRKVATFAKRET